MYQQESMSAWPFPQTPSTWWPRAEDRTGPCCTGHGRSQRSWPPPRPLTPRTLREMSTRSVWLKRCNPYHSVCFCPFLISLLAKGQSPVLLLNVIHCFHIIIIILIIKGENSIALEQSKRTFATGFSFNMGDAKCPCVCRGTKLSGRCVHSEKVREAGRG